MKIISNTISHIFLDKGSCEILSKTYKKMQTWFLYKHMWIFKSGIMVVGVYIQSE